MKSKITLNQKTLNFGHNDSYSEKDLYKSSCNEVAINLISNWPDWPINNRIFCIYGPLGSGKTHISKVWIKKSNALVFSDISHLNLDYFSNFHRNIVFEDVEPNKKWPENLLFEFINQIKSSKLSLLITCSKNPLNLQWKMKDLISRFTSFTNVEIKLPDDYLIKKILTKLFADRQLSLDHQHIDFITNRIERSYLSIINIVNKIDTLALQYKKSVTSSIVKEAIKSMNNLN